MSDQATNTTKQVNVSHQFANDFLLVTSHFECSLADIADMKVAARRNMADAKICFRENARMIMDGEL